MTYACADHDGKYGECLWNRPCRFTRDDGYAQCHMRNLTSHGKRLYPMDMPVVLRGV
jgi:hypothetical protein